MQFLGMAEKPKTLEEIANDPIAKMNKAQAIRKEV